MNLKYQEIFALFSLELVSTGCCYQSLSHELTGLGMLWCFLVFIDDSGVYTKNRNFRLYLSSKLGKDNPLVLSNNNKWQAGIDFKEDDLQQQIFVASLITKIG